MKLLMHYCALGCLCFMVNFSHINAQIEAELPDYTDGSDGSNNVSRSDCYTADLVIMKNGEEVGGVAEDCLEEYTYKLTIRKTCGKKGHIIGINCYDQIEVTLRDQLVGSGFFQIDPLGNSMTMFTGNFSDFDLTEFGSPHVHEFQIKITTYCTFWEHPGPPISTSFVSTMTVPFSLASDIGNSTYIVSRGIDYGSPPLVEVLECFNDWTPICCNRGTSCYEFESSGAISHSVINTSETTATISFGGSLSATGKSANEVFQASLNLSALGSYSVSRASVNKITYINSIKLKEKVCGIAGKCIVPGLQVVKHELVEEIWQPNCEGDDVMIDVVRTYLPTSVTWSELCVSNPLVDCDDIQIPNENKGINDGNNLAFSKSSECTGWITLGMNNTEGLSISWEGPGGFSASTFDIDNIEIGEYNYLITNACCEEISGSVTLCENFNYGIWYYDESTKDYCREVSCEEITSAKANSSSSCFSIECISPDEIIYTYDGSSCFEEHYYNGELLGSIVSDNSTETIDYNENSKSCIKILFCGDDPVNEINQNPTYGSWSYDYGTQLCVRSIFCFGELMEVQDNKEPEIEEVYNNTTMLCERTAYCNNSPITLPPAPPIVNGNWNWSQWQGCTKQVQCSFESGLMTITGNESFNNWGFNEFTNQCFSDVACENVWVPGATNNENPSFYGTWNWNSYSPFDQQCRREVYCGSTNSLVYQYTSPTFVASGIECPTIPGVSQHYVYCNGINTGITDCLISNDNPTTRSKKYDIQVFPNPTSGLLNIQGVDVADAFISISITDLAGRLTFKKKMETNAIDLSALTSGVYIISIMNETETLYINKFVKL